MGPGGAPRKKIDNEGAKSDVVEVEQRVSGKILFRGHVEKSNFEEASGARSRARGFQASLSDIENRGIGIRIDERNDAGHEKMVGDRGWLKATFVDQTSSRIAIRCIQPP